MGCPSRWPSSSSHRRRSAQRWGRRNRRCKQSDAGPCSNPHKSFCRHGFRLQEQKSECEGAVDSSAALRWTFHHPGNVPRFTVYSAAEPQGSPRTWRHRSSGHGDRRGFRQNRSNHFLQRVALCVELRRALFIDVTLSPCRAMRNPGLISTSSKENTRALVNQHTRSDDGNRRLAHWIHSAAVQ